MQIMIKPELQDCPLVISLEKDNNNKFSLKVFNAENSADVYLTRKDMNELREAITFFLCHE